MTDDVAKKPDMHERIRFRRDEIVDLRALPSSDGIVAPMAPKKKKSRWARLAVWSAVACLSVGLLAFAGLSYLSHSGLGASKIQAQAERALRQFAGSDVSISIADAHFSLSGPRLLNLELTDVSVIASGASEPMLQSADLSLGLNVLPLLSGHVSIASAELARARFNAASIPVSVGGDRFAGILNENGLIEPDLLLAWIFSGADIVGRAVSAGGAPDVGLKDITFELGAGLPFSTLTIKNALMEQSADGAKLAGVAFFDERSGAFDAKFERAEGSPDRVDKFQLDFRSAPVPQENRSFSFGDMTISVTGDRSGLEQPAKLFAVIYAEDLAVDLGTRGKLQGRIDMMTSLAASSGKIEIDRLNASIGGSTFRMTGAVGPSPADPGQSPPAYRFELVSNESELIPVDTGEPRMPMGMRLAGIYRPDTRLIDVGEVAISSATGTATGKASVQLTDAGPPGLSLALDVKGMSVSHVKQLWPWFAAESARRWVNKNLFGGSVPEGGIRFAVAPGRLGNGQRLGNDEVSGQFRIVGTRFDTTGLLPPIREADGQVNFSGDDVDIGLERGRVFLASGESIATDKGRLVIKDGGSPHVFGDLDIGVAGTASAIAELASLEPISAMQRTGIEPATLSGDVIGTIKARIPLQKNADKSQLNWDVRLGFKGLAVAKPIDGQTVRNANGSLAVDRTKVAINAKAELNDIPAELDILEPLPAGADLRRKRDISISLNNQSLRKLAPGLAGIVDGPVKLQVDASDRQSQRVEADLTGAVLSIPAVGWSKGGGVAAKASFDLQRPDAGGLQLADFKLTGGSFGISGAVSVADGNLTRARFDNFRLNRGDDASVRIDREGGSYSISVDGNSLDVRSFIRRATSPQTGSAVRGTPVALRGSVNRMIGFNDESLSGVTLNYRSGRSGSTLALNGQSDRGRSVSIETGEAGTSVRSQDAGSLLRFLDIYERVQGGTISARLQNGHNGSLSGAVDIRDFIVVNEPKLGSIAAAAPQRAGSTASIDAARVSFDRAFASLEKGASYLRLQDGILRGPTMGATFQGTLYDENNRMQITGTYMPAYGLNSIFGDVPVVGALLGNGEEKGLIGVTYKLAGNAKAPNLQINPLSAIAPGIFRTIFEFQ